MKFRGRMQEVHAMRRFYSVLTTLAKLTKTCILRLTPDKVYFVVAEAVNSDGFPSVWCELNPDHFFTDYSLEGVTPAENQIFMEFEPDQMAKNLTVLRGGGAVTPKSLKLKLTRKRDTPCLSFEIEGLVQHPDPQDRSGGLCRLCTHDFPVTLLPRKQWKDYKEPTVGAVDVSLYLPELKVLRHLSEKYKALGQRVTLLASRAGQLKLCMVNERINLSTFFKYLEVPKVNNLAGNLNTDDTALEASVSLDLKKFSLFLGVDVSFRKVLANFIHKKTLHLFLLDDDLYIQYLIPAKAD